LFVYSLLLFRFSNIAYIVGFTYHEFCEGEEQPLCRLYLP
jgi:hypothetical protein